jgi:hypothetical protein
MLFATVLQDWLQVLQGRGECIPHPRKPLKIVLCNQRGYSDRGRNNRGRDRGRDDGGNGTFERFAAENGEETFACLPSKDEDEDGDGDD